MTTITIRQYRPSEPVVLSPAALGRILTDYSTRVSVAPAGGGAVIMSGNSYVGLIRLGELDLVIQPKVPTLSVFWMLGYADRLVRFDPAEFPFEREPGLLDILARLFAKQTEFLIRHGLYREYVERDENLRFVRGRILPIEDLRANRGLHHRVVCRYGDLTADVPHNRILRAVTDQLLRFRFHLSGITEQLAWNASHFAEVNSVPLNARDFADLRYGRLNVHYQAVHALAKLIVEHFTFRFEAGEQLAPSFLANMDDVYQEFLTRLVEEQAKPFGLRLRRPGGLFLAEGHRVPVDPDIVLTDGHRVRAVIDAKYKLIDANADVYQALAYAKALDVDRVALVYPADGEVAAHSYSVLNDDTVVLVRTVPVGHGGAGFVDLESRARIAATSLVRELLDGPAARASVA